MHKSLQLSVIIPVYNEIDTILEIVNRIRSIDLAARPRSTGKSTPEVNFYKQIIVVDDGSTDGTRAVLQREAKKGDITIAFHERNQGKGAAVWTGWQLATGDVYLIQDADLEYDPGDYPLLLQPIVEGRAKVVYGSRFLSGGQSAMALLHAFGNRFLTQVANLLYNSRLSDMETCYKLISKEVANQIRLDSTRWGFDPELTAKILKRHYPIVEVPINYTGRKFQEGKKIKWRDGFSVVWTLVKYRLVD